jgi:hypothetical protein
MIKNLEGQLFVTADAKGVSGMAAVNAHSEGVRIRARFQRAKVLTQGLEDKPWKTRARPAGSVKQRLSIA